MVIPTGQKNINKGEVNMFETKITKMFGIKYPIIQGAMQWLAKAELASAVSNAGGLGIIVSAAFTDKEELRAEIRKAKTMTDKPFGVNMVFLPHAVPIDYEGYIDVIIEEGVKITETAGALRQEYATRLKENGVKIIHKVVAVKHAMKAQDMGCDAVTIDGCECGGHPGEFDTGSIVLLPKAADTLSIPIVASGGYADGRGLVAALALGAEGILMGTRFMMSKESPMHDKVKSWLVGCNETDTIILLRSFKNSMRAIKNNVALQVRELEDKNATFEDVFPLVSGQRGKDMLDNGNVEDGVLACGQVIGLIKDYPSVKEIIDGIVNQAAGIINRLNALK
ncbi:MAG: NAD(P)H-dependent flavin oxidoreductase [Bacillota bacterium]